MQWVLSISLKQGMKQVLLSAEHKGASQAANSSNFLPLDVAGKNDIIV